MEDSRPLLQLKTAVQHTSTNTHTCTHKHLHTTIQLKLSQAISHTLTHRVTITHAHTDAKTLDCTLTKDTYTHIHTLALSPLSRVVSLFTHRHRRRHTHRHTNTHTITHTHTRTFTLMHQLVAINHLPSTISHQLSSEVNVQSILMSSTILSAIAIQGGST